MDQRMTRIQELFHAALGIEDIEARRQFLRQECVDDRDLYQKVIQLVDQADGSTFFLDQDAVSTPKEASLQKLGKYRIVERIGKGGMGVVFLAFDPDLRRKVALKIPASLKLLSEQSIARFKAEARAVAALDVHPNIVRIHSLELEQNPPFIVMEHLQGHDLGQIVANRGALPALDAAQHIVSVAKGLGKAHENKIIHRDVKPQNIFVTSDGITKVLDLGLAKLPSSKVRTTTESINARTDSQGGGSIEFISPEQSTSLANADFRSDIYSLGCTFYFLLTGEVPFPGLDREETVLAHCTAPRPSILDKVAVNRTNEQLDTIIQKMMSISAMDRHSSMSEVIDSVNNTIDESKNRRLRERKRYMIGAGLTAALMMLFWVVWSLIPPSYRFELEKVADATEVSALIKIGDQISTVKQWLTDYSKQSKQVAKLLRKDQQAESFKEFMVAGDRPGLGDINKALLVLDHFHQGSIPSGWLALDEGTLATKIKSSLQAANEQDMTGRVETLVRKPESKLILDRWGIEDFPSSKYPARQLQWIAALEKAIEEGVRPTADWYETIRSTKEIEFGQSKIASLFVRQRSSETRFQGDASVSSFDVWMRIKSGADADDASENDPSAGQLVELETGIRLIDVALKRDDTNQVKILWPPRGGVVDHNKLENFLQYHGLPKAFKLSREVLRFETQTDRPAFDIQFDVVHEDLTQCSTKNQISFDVSKENLFEHDPQPYEEVSKTLEAQLGLLTNFRGFDLDIQKNELDSGYSGNLSIDGVGKLPCTVGLDREYRVMFAIQPSMAELESFAKFICGQSEEFRELESYCSIRALEVDPENALLRGEVAFSTLDHPAVAWSLDPTGAFNMVAPLALATEVVNFKEEKKAKRKDRLSEDQLLAEINKQLAKSRFKPYIEIGKVYCNDLANGFTLGISIGDLPRVRLNPIEVSSIGEVEAAIDNALSFNHLSSQINQFWGGVSTHPRFGRSIAKLQDWDPARGQADIQTTMLFAGGAIPLSITERVTLREQTWDYQIFNPNTKNWIPSNSKTIARVLQEATPLKELCDSVGAYTTALTGMRVSVKLDDDIASPWFRLGPPSMMFQAKLGVPMLYGTELGFGKLQVSQDRVDVPNAVIVQPKLSVPCGYFTASDPRVEVDFEKNQLKLGVKVTPLFPGVKAPRTSATLAAYQLTGLPLSEVRWDNLFLHAGHVFVQVDGQFEAVGESTQSRYTFGAQGELVVLEDTKLAQCRGEVALINWQLDRLNLALDASVRPVGIEIGSLEGDFTLMPQREVMRLSGSMDIRGLFISGDLDYQSSATGDGGRILIGDKIAPGGISVAARADVAGIGEAKLTGASDFSFQDYCLKSTGTVPVPFMESYWRYIVTATQDKFKIEWIWETPSGETVSYTTEAPRADLIDADELFAELQLAYETSIKVELRDGDAATGTGVIPGGQGDDGEKKFTSTVPLDNQEDDFERPKVNIQIDGDELKVVYADAPDNEIGRIRAKEVGVGSWDSIERWIGWTPDDALECYCIEEGTANSDGRVFPILFEPGGEVRYPSIEILDGELEFAARTGALRPYGPSLQTKTARATLVGSIMLRLHGYRDVNITDMENGFILGARDGMFKSIYRSYSYDESNINRFFYLDLEPTEREAAIKAFSRGISGIESGLDSQSFIIAVNLKSQAPQAAVIRRLSRDQFKLQIQHNGSISEHTMERVDGVSVYQVYQLARKFAESVWSQNVIPDDLIFVGRAGACVPQADGWLLLPSDNFSDARLDSFVQLSKTDFVKGWSEFGNQAAESEVLLPVTLRSSEKRSRCRLDVLARVCVVSWADLKKENDREQRWFAHPMGLLIELALLNQDKN